MIKIGFPIWGNGKKHSNISDEKSEKAPAWGYDPTIHESKVSSDDLPKVESPVDRTEVKPITPGVYNVADVIPTDTGLAEIFINVEATPELMDFFKRFPDRSMNINETLENLVKRVESGELELQSIKTGLEGLLDEYRQFQEVANTALGRHYIPSVVVAMKPEMDMSGEGIRSTTSLLARNFSNDLEDDPIGSQIYARFETLRWLLQNNNAALVELEQRRRAEDGFPGNIPV
ncbi:MAG: hypothetical protein Q8P30_01420 [Candidatus Uhrbacteria bacterium]|nr:hypothetical protein [Candidatus Uhrbacteria bacterium]